MWVMPKPWLGWLEEGKLGEFMHKWGIVLFFFFFLAGAAALRSIKKLQI